MLKFSNECHYKIIIISAVIVFLNVPKENKTQSHFCFILLSDKILLKKKKLQ